jgi:hypothetical protein
MMELAKRAKRDSDGKGENQEGKGTERCFNQASEEGKRSRGEEGG